MHTTKSINKPPRGGTRGLLDSPTEKLKPFTYQPLDSASDEIRLVRLQPGCSKDYLGFDIHNVAIKRAPPFKALSYAWGKSSERTSVRFNDGVFKVNNTLYQFLVQVTETSEDARAYYWIDAISIDQGNVAERSEQVLRMKGIYEAAAQIVVWLGSPRIPAPITSQPNASTSKLLESGLISLSSILLDLNILESVRLLRRQAERTKLDLAFARIYEDSWWERAWIIQEASTPAVKDASQPNAVWVGPYRYDLDACIRASGRFHVPLEPENSRYRVPTMVDDLAWITARRSNVKSGLELEIYDLLPRVRRYEASDLRDKIYSILAISCDYDAKDLKPDYGKPTPEIYTGLVRYLIERDQKLDILAYCTEKRNIEGLPSWVPDWSYKNVPVPFPRRSYFACGDLPWKVSFQNWGSSIRCKGVQIAAVQDVGPVRDEAANHGHNNRSATSQSWFTFGMMSLSLKAYHRTYIGQLDALRHVMCADVSEWDGSAKRTHVVRWPSLEESQRFSFSERDFVNDSDMDKATNLRRLMSLDKDFLGLGPAEASAGDFVYVLCGLQVPLVLRKVQEHFLIVGECYVHGIMDAARPWEQHQIHDIDIW